MLDKCIESVYAHLEGLDAEIIVVDNASEDKSVQMIKSKYPDISLIINEHNAGFAQANNQGLATASGKYILFLNNDTVVLDNAFSKMVEFLEKNPEAGIVGCKLLNPDKTIQPSCANYPSSHQAIAVLSMFTKGAGAAGFKFSYDRTEKVDVVSGACFMVRREVLEEVGAFDEKFYFYGEESDLCLRVKKTHWQTYFVPSGNIIHYRQSTFNRLPTQQMSEIKTKGSFLFYKKHYGGVYLAIYGIWTFCHIILGTLFWSAAYPFMKDKKRLQQKSQYYKGMLNAIFKLKKR